MGRTGKVRYSLDTMARRDMWPTPVASNNRKSRKAMTMSQNNGRRSGGGNSSPPGLEQVVELSMGIYPKEMPPPDQVPHATQELIRRMWPTPLARDYKTPGMSKERLATRSPDNLTSAIRMTEGTGALNPTWVEWLMGFPSEWTALDVSEMPLSRRSRKSSGAQS
jgi:hypothetical protein